MTDKAFVEKILTLKPTDKEVADLHYPDGLLEHWIGEFNIQKKAIDVEAANPILSLIENYNLSGFSVHDITFEEKVVEDQKYYYFGWDVTTNRLAIDKNNNKILSYDYYGEKVAYQCAGDASLFLDALYEIMAYVKEKILNNYEEDQMEKRSKQVAYIAALKAGGEAYEDYYKTILGVE